MTGQVLRSQRSERLTDARSALHSSQELLGLEADTALLVPLAFRGRSVGVLAAFDHLGAEAGFDDEDERLLGAFAASAATAVATGKSVEEQRLRQSIEASEHERRRWARELHDETLQSLAGAARRAIGGAARQRGRGAGSRRSSRASSRRSARSVSRCELTDTYSPAAIESAPATNLATLAIPIARAGRAGTRPRRAQG